MDKNPDPVNRRGFLRVAAGTAVSAGAVGTVAAQENGSGSDGGNGGDRTGSGGGSNQSGTGGQGGGGSEQLSLPESAKAAGIGVTIAMISTLGLAYFFMRYGGDYVYDPE